jgi:hypothetical protein
MFLKRPVAATADNTEADIRYPKAILPLSGSSETGAVNGCRFSVFGSRPRAVHQRFPGAAIRTTASL